MSGETRDSHPFLIHAINTCHLLDGHAIGRTDIRTFAKQLRDVYDDNRKHVRDLPHGDQNGLVEQFIWWSTKGEEYFGGRPVLDHERSDRRVMSTTESELGIEVEIEFSARSISQTRQTMVGEE